MRSSLKISNAWIADGSGAPLFKGEVLISGGTVSAVGKDVSGGAAADRTIDLRKQVLAPGFIDAHGHSDLALLAHPDGFSKVSQGVTTEIAGNCGLCAFCLSGRNRAHLENLYANYNYPLAWRDYRSFQTALKKRGVALNLPALCGHNSLRAAIAGYEKEKLSETELQDMCALLDAQLKQGAVGLSAGLLYVPGIFATTGELVELMRVVSRHDKIFTTHLRSEGKTLLESLEETLAAARAAGLKRIQISHFKTAGRDNWGKLDAAIALIEKARAENIRVTVDRYPYTESMTQLSVVLPGKWDALPDRTIQQKLQNDEECRQLAADLRAARAPGYWQGVRLVSTTGNHRADSGKFLAGISADPAMLVVELLRHDAPGTTAAFSGMSRENLERILDLDYCMPGSDGNALPVSGDPNGTHPRAFGAIARFLRLRLDRTGDIARSVYRATGLPAQTFQLDAGKIAVGAAADLVAFDPETINSFADFTNPCRIADGILFTIHQGGIVYQA
ncbi:MAG: amidohydrolase family protein [Victivallaceae bacterium]|nr:amidohydrolase family protein [Victivallaceae bacterium]